MAKKPKRKQVARAPDGREYYQPEVLCAYIAQNLPLDTIPLISMCRAVYCEAFEVAKLATSPPNLGADLYFSNQTIGICGMLGTRLGLEEVRALSKLPNRVKKARLDKQKLKVFKSEMKLTLRRSYHG